MSFCLSKLEWCNLASVSASGFMMVFCRRASIRVRFADVESAAAAEGFIDERRAIIICCLLFCEG